MSISGIYEALEQLNDISAIFRIVLALFLSSLIGSERGKHGRAAGLRTHILISVGSCITIMIGIFMHGKYGSDATRIAAQVISGIGFLGTGMILVKNNAKVTGLTTAATMWTTGAVGLACGAGFYSAAVVGGLIIYCVVAYMTIFEINHKLDRRFIIELENAKLVVPVLRQIRERYPETHNEDILNGKSGIAGHVGLAVNIANPDVEELIDRLMEIEGIVYVIEE